MSESEIWGMFIILYVVLWFAWVISRKPSGLTRWGRTVTNTCLWVIFASCLISRANGAPLASIPATFGVVLGIAALVSSVRWAVSKFAGRLLIAAQVLWLLSIWLWKVAHGDEIDFSSYEIWATAFGPVLVVTVALIGWLWAARAKSTDAPTT